MKAIIMAGGEGSRLRPLTNKTPKPLLKLCGRPTVEYILDLLAQHGCDEAIFTLRYLGEEIERHFEAGEYNGIRLRFSYEDEPLGTAGCVKKAAAHLNEDFVVISGDALCDFDLSAALRFHQQNQSDITILTARVSDPREYGLVLTKDNRVTGFSEKPSYLNCVSDFANTGVYIIRPEMLRAVPDNRSYDFAKDLFPILLQQKANLLAYHETGYWCDIGDLQTYFSSQLDMLNGRVACQIPGKKLGDGIYANSPIPKTVQMKPPCYIGKNVDIGSSCTLEGSMLFDNVTIGQSSNLYHTIVFDGAWIANHVVSEQSILCQNAKIKQKAKLEENTVIGSNTIVGEKCTIHQTVKIWDNKQIMDNAHIRCDIRQKQQSRFAFSEYGIEGSTNIDITPETAARIGCAVSSLDTKQVLLSCSGCSSAIAVKQALSSGIASTGVTVLDCGTATLPMLIQLSDVLHTPILIHVEAAAQTNIAIRNRYGLPLTRTQERNLESSLNRGEYRSAPWTSFGQIKSLSYSDTLYTAFLETVCSIPANYQISLQCPNEQLLAMVQPVFAAISAEEGETLVISLDKTGTIAEFQVTKEALNFKLSHQKLLLLACVELLKTNHDIALPADFPASGELLAQNFGKTVYRYFACTNDDSDKQGRTLAATERFLFDGVYLALYVLNWLSKEGMSLHDALDALPAFCNENRTIAINCPPQRILSQLYTETQSGIGEGVVLGGANERVLVRANKKGNALFLFSESASQETASALCDDVEEQVKQLLEENKEN